MRRALYGPDGFYRRERPAAHFRTSVTGGPEFAGAVRELAERVDAALGRPDPFDLVDVGAADGALLAGLGAVPARWRLTGVDLNGRYTTRVPPVTGLLVANEWLDNVPLDVLEAGRVVQVDPAGEESPGPPADPADLAWAARWWPRAHRVEVGRPRDAAWAAAVRRVRRGLAVAVDYGHTAADRRPTLTGYRLGRPVRPVPDGRCDLTAHVALDSCAAAAGSRLLRQRTALQRLGLRGSPVPAAADPPAGRLAALAAAGRAAALLDPAGLGGYGWLVAPVGIADPLAG